MMYLVELITTMTLVYNMEVPSVTSTEPISQSIASNNNKKKSSDTLRVNPRKQPVLLKRALPKESRKEKSHKKNNDQSSSSSSKRPPPRPTTSRSSSTRPTSQSSSRPSSRSTSQSSTSRPTTKSSSRPSSSSSSQRSGHSKNSIVQHNHKDLLHVRFIHLKDRHLNQKHLNRLHTRMQFTEGEISTSNQSRTNVPKICTTKTPAGVKVHPSHSNSKVKKPSPNISKSSKGSQSTTGGRSPNLSQEQLRERREFTKIKNQKRVNQKNLHDIRPPKHSPIWFPIVGVVMIRLWIEETPVIE